MKLLLRMSVLIFIIAGLTSCLIPIPRQMSRHVYTIPATAEGKMCINQCMNIRAACTASAKQTLDKKGHSSCVITALSRSGNRIVESPVNYSYWSGAKSPNNCTMYYPESSCGQYDQSANRYESASSCDNAFNNCVSSCGGSYKVETKTICWGAVE